MQQRAVLAIDIGGTKLAVGVVDEEGRVLEARRAPNPNPATGDGETVLRARVTERIAPGVVYTTFHFPETNANVVTTENSDWATNCPEYKVTAVEVVLVNLADAWRKRTAEERAMPRPPRRRTRDPAPA